MIIKKTSKRLSLLERAADQAAFFQDVTMPGLPFHLIGIGVGEGSIEPLRTILFALPARVNGAFFILKHLPPDFPNFTRQLLEHHTQMPIHEAAHGMVIRPGHLYFLPANHYMTVKRGVLRLEPREPRPKSNRAIDIFLISLAADAGCLAVGILLSGSGSDGIAGLEQIMRAGGTTLVLDPETASHPELPKNAVGAGTANFTLAPDAIAELLTELVKSG
jgi:two-component system CheB/CheR fusion protein